ncbi:hypothetical protein [Chromohalobacter nigrandesensis]|nr:hypothetical protein [Chromohalobacter nigrandesensis]
MKLNDSQKKGAGIALSGILGIFTGQFLPPDVFTSLIGAFV